MMKFVIKYGLIIILVASGCSKWSTTEDLSHESQLPVFTLEGEEFMAFEPIDSGEFKDPGVTALANGKELTVYTFGEPDMTKVGVYVIIYYAKNADGLANTSKRVIAVRDIDVTNNDLSGTYSGTWWSPQVEMKVKKIDPKGYYKVGEVLGYPGSDMPGNFVDMGNNDLVLVNGEGDFGRYEASEGTYTRSSLNWTISLIDSPYDGVEVPVIWHKEK